MVAHRAAVTLKKARPRPRLRSQEGFTLIELLVVLAIIIILMALTLPAFSVINARKFAGNVTKITAVLDLARDEARSKNTYTWVLFRPWVNAQQIAQLTVVVIGSRDGTDPIAWGAYPNVVPDNVIQIVAPPLTISQIQLNPAGTFAAQVPSVPSPAGTTANDFNSQISVQMNVVGQGTVTFQKAVRYVPSNGAGNNNQSSNFIEFGLQPLNGTVPDGKNIAVVRIDKASGSLQVYKP